MVNDRTVASYEFETGKGVSTANRVRIVINNRKDIVYSYDNNGNMETITENRKVIKKLPKCIQSVA